MNFAGMEIFPIKFIDGLILEEARVAPGGILEHDRVYAIMDRDGRVVNGKRTARVHQLRCAFDPLIKEVQLWQSGSSPAQFRLDDPGPIGKWLTDFFGFPATLRRDSQKGFPDDRVASSPTLTSEASLQAIE